MVSQAERRQAMQYDSEVRQAWHAYGDARVITAIVEVSAKVSTNHVYRLHFGDTTSAIAKVSSYGSYFLFCEDHDRLHACHDLLAGTRHARLLADVLTKDDRPFTHYDGTTWVVFYDEVPRGRSLPRVLTDGQITTFAQEIALFHRACADIAPKIPLTSTSIKADAIHLLDLVTNTRSANARADSTNETSFSVISACSGVFVRNDFTVQV